MAAEAPTLSIYKAARRIKRRETTLYNALRSVADDAAFVAEVAALWPALPLVANLRCGLWYAPPRAFVATCYFKSTDGHAGNWSFSTARLNLHLALLAGTLLLSSSSGQIYSHHLILDHVSSLWDVNMIPRCR
jgi:tRNA A64-2'-O-ribosylphosphate transferase